MATPQDSNLTLAALRLLAAEDTDLDVTLLTNPPDVPTNTSKSLQDHHVLQTAYLARLERAYQALLDRHNTCAVELARARAETIDALKSASTSQGANTSQDPTPQQLKNVARRIAPLPGYSIPTWTNKPTPYSGDVRCWFADFEQVMLDTFGPTSDTQLRTWASYFSPQRYVEPGELSCYPTYQSLKTAVINDLATSNTTRHS